MRPKYDYGAEVRVIRNLRNDGTYPGLATGTLLVRRGSIGFVRDVGWLRPYVNIAGYLLPLVGFGIAMIWFEILVYVGAVSCRFANPPRANTPKRDA